MQRKSFGKLCLTGIGYVVLGNVLCFVITLAMGAFLGNDFFKWLLILLTFFIFFSLIFTVGWKDGARERSLMKNKRVESPLPNRWIYLGLIMWGFAALPCIILLLNKLCGWDFDFLGIFRFINGSAYPFILTFVEPVAVIESETTNMLMTNERLIDNMSAVMPIIFTAYYALIPVFTKLGWHVGYNDLFNEDKIMYKQ